MNIFTVFLKDTNNKYKNKEYKYINNYTLIPIVYHIKEKVK